MKKAWWLLAALALGAGKAAAGEAEARKALDEHIVESADLVDAGVIFGTGFAPFRGGPMNYLKERTA